MNSKDKFYFYHSSIGDLFRLMKKHQVLGQVESPGFITNAFGVKIRPKFFPFFPQEKCGVEPLPVPANWHADMAEFGSALRAVDLAEKEFTIIELGCGWGCWLNIAGVVAKRKGLKVNLVGVEGDEGHVTFALEALNDNGFDSSEYTIHRGIASARDGTALFPKQGMAGASWGLEPIFDATPERTKVLLENGSYEALDQKSLESLVQKNERVDLLQIDIQGGEIPLIPEAINFLENQVAMVLIGTHSRSIEGRLVEILSEKGWRLEVERPAVLSVGKNIETLVDGVQLWRNPHLISDKRAHEVDSQGAVHAVSFPESVCQESEFEIEVETENGSNTDWISTGDYPVRLSYHWKKGDDIVEFEGVRTSFCGGQLNSGSSANQKMNVIAPNFQGALQLMITVVQDEFRWFDSTGFLTEVVDIYIERS